MVLGLKWVTIAGIGKNEAHTLYFSKVLIFHPFFSCWKPSMELSFHGAWIQVHEQESTKTDTKLVLASISQNMRPTKLITNNRENGHKFLSTVFCCCKDNHLKKRLKLFFLKFCELLSIIIVMTSKKRNILNGHPLRLYQKTIRSYQRINLIENANFPTYTLYK